MWLAYRFCTERICQFHFQCIHARLGPAVAAMRDESALDANRAARATAPKAPPADDPDLVLLLDALRQLRLGVQERYSGAKLVTNAHAPGTRANLFGLAGDLGTGIVVLFAFLSGLAMAIPAMSKLAVWFWSIVGVFSAVGLMARVMDQGLQANVDHERYAWYHAAVLAAATRFDDGSTRDKIASLRDLEVLAYQEMRRFIVAHLRAKFLM